MKKPNRSAKKNHYSGIIAIVIILAILIVKTFVVRDRLSENEKFTIGQVNEIIERGRSGVGILFKFEYKSKSYDGTFETTGLAKDLSSLKSKRFLVRFDTIHPKNCQMMVCYPIPDTVKSEKTIWKKIPNFEYSSLRNNSLLKKIGCK